VAGAELGRSLVAALLVFVTTNIDDIVILSVLFADPKLRTRSVVLGQFLGIGALVVVSALAGLASVAIPPGWPALLGVIPLGLGIHKVVVLVRGRRREEKEPDPVRAGRSQILAVAAVTIANGGDNVGVYVPIFATERGRILLYVAVFAVMTAVWCVLGFKLVHNRVFGARLERWGHVVLPIVLVALGLHILSGAWPLLRRS
jgi:cadmium resistance protein CadD (predicted permease)